MSRDPDSFNRNNLPSWLRDQQLPPKPDEADGEADDAIPDWLRDVSAASLPPAASTSPSTPSPGDEMPDWLQPRADEEASDWLGSSTSQPDSAGQNSAPATSDAEALPDWLREIAEQEQPEPQLPPQPFAQPAAPAPPEAPAWLNDEPPPQVQPFTLDFDGGVAPFSLPPEARSGSAPSADEIPRWLREAAATNTDDAPHAVPDWLRDQPATAEASGPADDAPDWLRELDTPADADSAPSSAPAWLPDQPTTGEANGPADDAPDWLRELDTPADADSASSSAPAWLREAAPSADTAADAASPPVPAWLRDFEPPTDAPSPNVSAASQEPLVAPRPPDEALPAWLRDVPDEAPRADTVPPWMHKATHDDSGAEADAPADATDAPLPDWLRELPADDRSLAAPEVPGMAAPAEDVPAWLRHELPQTSSPVPQPPIAPTLPPVPNDPGLPTWLRDASNEEPTPTEPGLPTWLRDAPTELPPPQPFARDDVPSVASSATTGASGADTLPPWINAREEQVASGSNEMLRGTDLPAWLVAETGTTPQEDAEDTRALGWLARLRTTDEEAEGTALRTAADVARPQVVRRQVPAEALALLQQLSAEPFAQPSTPTVRTTTRPPIVGIERLMMAVLLLCALVGVLAPNLALPFAPSGAAASPSVEQLYQTIDALDERSVVLLAYEWDARRGSELAPLERGITDHLSARNAGIVTLSTDPQGTLLSLDLRDRLRAAGYGEVGDINGDGTPDFRGGVDDLFLGYLPGGDLALRGLVQNFSQVVRRDFAGNDTSESAFVTGQLKGRPELNSLDQVALIVVLADETQDVQGWVEQVHSRAPQVPMALVAPAEAGPVLQPYLTSSRLMSLVGQDDALAYSGQLAQLAPGAGQQLEQLVGARNLGLLAFVLLVLGGGLVVMLKRT